MTSKLELRRRQAVTARVDFHGLVDPRRIKKMERTMFDPLYVAYLEGSGEAASRKPRPNPYPPGLRHEEWHRGFALADDHTSE